MHFYHFNLTNWMARIAAVALTIASLSAQPYAYVANIAGNNVSVINTSNNALVTTISVPSSPSGVAVTPDGTAVYVACQGANSVAVINAATNTVSSTIPVGTTPVALAITPNGAQVYVVNRGANTVSVIDTASKTVIGTVGVGSRPLAVAISPDGTKAYVANLWGISVSMISTSTRTVTGTFSTAAGPNAVAVAPNGRVYVSQGNGGAVSVHSATGGLLQTLSGFTSPDWVAINASGTRLVVANGNGSSASIVDTASGSTLATLPTGTIPTSVAITPDGLHAYVANEYSLSVSVIDLGTNTVTKTLAYSGAYPYSVGIRPPAGGTTPTCSYTLSQSSGSFGTTGGSSSVSVTAPSGCSWSVTDTLSWVHITAGASGSGNGTVSYSVDANTGSSQRSGSITIAGHSYSITQAGISCTYSLQTTSANLGAAGGTGSVNLTAGTGCTWSASSDQTWLTITAGLSGSGSGSVSFSAAANTSTSQRTGHLTIGGQTYTVTEAGTAFSPIRVRFGGPQYTDPSGKVWLAGNATKYSVTDVAIANTTTQPLYQADGWSTGTLQYQYTVPNGSFTVQLKFAEFYLMAAGQRTFNIVVNGTTFYASFDILSHVAPNTAYDVSIPVSVTNGQITIQLVPVTGTPKLNALEIF